MDGAFGKAVLIARNQRGVKQQELADRIGMQRSYLSKIEKGHINEPETENQLRIAAGLGMTVEELWALAPKHPMTVADEGTRRRAIDGIQNLDIGTEAGAITLNNILSMLTGIISSSPRPSPDNDDTTASQ